MVSPRNKRLRHTGTTGFVWPALKAIFLIKAVFPKRGHQVYEYSSAFGQIIEICHDLIHHAFSDAMPLVIRQNDNIHNERFLANTDSLS